MASLKYWLWLATRKGVGVQSMHAVLDHFGTPERAFFADPEEYDLLPGALGRALRDRSMAEADKILADCDRLGIRIMTLQDADLPLPSFARALMVVVPSFTVVITPFSSTVATLGLEEVQVSS